MGKKSGNLNKGPFTFRELDKVIRGQGWQRVRGAKHLAYKHPTKPGKINVGQKWEHVKYGSVPFRGIARQAGLTPKELLQLLNQ